MTAIDPRIAARRHHVREQGARRRMRWILLLLAVLALVLGGWWLVESPYLAVERITVTGRVNADTAAALERAGLSEGVATLRVRTGDVERELRADPWVRDAAVTIEFPHGVEARVLEHEAFAAVETVDGWRLVAADGTVLAAADATSQTLGVVQGAPAAVPGAVMADQATLGALEFLAALPVELRPLTTVMATADGHRATVAGVPARLGAPRDMAAKGAVVAALLRDGVESGWTIDVIAPTRPALLPPPQDLPAAEAQPEGQGAEA